MIYRIEEYWIDDSDLAVMLIKTSDDEFIKIMYGPFIEPICRTITLGERNQEIKAIETAEGYLVNGVK